MDSLMEKKEEEKTVYANIGSSIYRLTTYTPNPIYTQFG